MTENKGLDKKYQRAPYSKFVQTREALGWKAARLSQELGYSPSASHTWEKDGEMPMVAFLACDTLIAKHKANSPMPMSLVVLEFHGPKLLRSRVANPNMTMEVNGKKHWLVEQ